MAFEKVSKILKIVDDAQTSVLSFNCTDYNMIYSAIMGANAVKKPVIITLYPEHHNLNNTISLRTFTAAVKQLADNVDVPVGLHLDHCSDFDYIITAIKEGFSSVMYDGSMLSMEDNIKNSKKVIEIAKIFDVDVEGELGHIGFANDNAGNDKDAYTKAFAVKEYCEQTGITSVAIAIGSAHGFYKEAPKLDIERLKEINAITQTFLVLHGGSGIGLDQLQLAFNNGINKLNIGAEYFYIYYKSIQEYANQYKDDGNVFDIPKFVQAKLIEYIKTKLEISEIKL